jgi:hypothetical protein
MIMDIFTSTTRTTATTRWFNSLSRLKMKHDFILSLARSTFWANHSCALLLPLLLLLLLLLRTRGMRERESWILHTGQTFQLGFAPVVSTNVSLTYKWRFTCILKVIPGLLHSKLFPNNSPPGTHGEKSWLVHAWQYYHFDFFKHSLSVICPLCFYRNCIIFDRYSMTWRPTPQSRNFPIIFLLSRSIKGMSSTWPARFLLWFFQRFGIGHLPTCFVE